MGKLTNPTAPAMPMIGIVDGVPQIASRSGLDRDAISTEGRAFGWLNGPPSRLSASSIQTRG